MEGAEAVVIVTDDGTGIAKDMLPRVFEMFTQGESSPALGGLGIGLWLAKSVVELHGGSIEAHSDGLGKGSEFIVRLPRIVERGAAVPAGASESFAGAAFRRILVVDDLRDSADTQPEDRQRTQEAGFDEHLVKPVDAARLAALLSALPNRSPAKNQLQATLIRHS